jgi:hypothetical protein
VNRHRARPPAEVDPGFRTHPGATPAAGRPAHRPIPDPMITQTPTETLPPPPGSPARAALAPAWGGPPPPPSAATPPGFSLQSGVGTPIVGTLPDGALLCSAAADGTLWLATMGSAGGAALWSYDFGQAKAAQVYAAGAAAFACLSAVSVDEAWVVVFDGSAGSPWVGRCAGGEMTRMAALPGGAVPAQVSAAADGTVWVLSMDGAPFVLTGATATPVAAPGLKLSSVSVGSADHVLAVGTGGVLSWSPQAGWQPFVQGQGPWWIAACADGSTWMLASGVLTVRLPDGALTPMDVSAVQAVNWTAGSRMSAFALGALGGQTALVPVSLGVLDLPPTPWPAMTAGQQKAYDCISQALHVPGGVRAQYLNSAEPFTDWYATLLTLDRPADISMDDWTVVTGQIGTELVYVQSVYNLFSGLARLTGDIGSVQSLQLQGVASAVGLTVQAQGPSKVTVMLEALMSAVLTNVGGLFPAPFNLAISLVGTGIATAVGMVTQKYNPGDSSQDLTVAYSELATVLAETLTQAVVVQEQQQTAILGDWGKLSAAGEAIAQGIWSWPVDAAGTSLAALEPAMQRYFYQALMPARWQILQGMLMFGVRFPNADPRAPVYAMLTRDVVDAQNDYVVWYYICCGRGSEAAILDNDGPWPAQQLLQEIFALGVEPVDFFSGQNGWALPVVQSPGWTDPPARVPWNPYAG